METSPNKKNSLKHVLFGSLIGTTIEFFDFYIYANAAVLVFPQLFFPSSDSTMATLESTSEAPHRFKSGIQSTGKSALAVFTTTKRTQASRRASPIIRLVSGTALSS